MPLIAAGSGCKSRAYVNALVAIGISDLGMSLAERLEETLPEEAKAFLDFIRTKEGADSLKSNGYLPIN